jgi:amino acid adenylation domain-containing protein
LVNLYGASETTLIKTFYRIPEITGNQAQAIPVGIPINNTIVAIIKEERLCIPGETGEIYIKTPFATKGYYKNEALTKQNFVQNPLQKEKADLVYKTGDLGRWLRDGNIEVLGRKDNQIKINGIRVELREVENAVLEIEEVTGTVVKEYCSDDNITVLIAYYTGKKLEISRLRDRLTKTLNPQLIPSWFLWLEEFPLNINGKLDKKSLPLPSEFIKDDRDFQLPIGEVENALAECWKDILKCDIIERNVSLFSLGGHSLHVIQMVSRIGKVFNVKLKVADIFVKSTIIELAELIEVSLRYEYQRIKPVKLQVDYPLSYAQRRLWMLTQFKESSVAYNMPGVYVFEGELSLVSLDYAFAELINRHEILRTVFKENESGEIRQFILSGEEVKFSIENIDLRKKEDKNDKLKVAIHLDCVYPFDLAKEPCLKVKIYRTEDHKWIFSYVVHHIISDAWSMNILISELLQVYNASVRNNKYILPGLPMQYKDYAAWQKEQLSGVQLEKHRQFWLAQFKGEIPVLEMPLDNPRPPLQTFNGERIIKSLDIKYFNALKVLCGEQDSTLYMGLLALVNTLLYKYTNQEDIIIGSPSAGREHVELENQIGFYINTLALRMQFKGTDSFTELLQKIKGVTLGVFEHQSYPFDVLIDDLQLMQDRSRNVLYDVAVTLQNTASNKVEQLAMEQITISHYEEWEKLICRCDLLFFFIETDGVLQLVVEYNSDLFNKQTINRLADHLEQLLGTVTISAGTAICELDYLNAQEKEKLVLDFNQTAVSFPEDQTIVSLFEQQAVLHPNHIAVVFGQVKLTYKELDEQTNRFANYLIANHQIQDGELVGIMLDRSEKLIVAILGILKAGGAYVPIDPGYPENRKTYILKDTGINLLITQIDYLFDLEYFKGDIFAIDVQMDGIDNDINSPGLLIPANQLAYIIYTSGSTGIPKGVMIEHAGIANTIYAQRRAFDIGSHDRGLQFASPSFDAAVSEIFIILTAGATLYIITENEKKNPSLFEQYISTNCISIATVPPVFLQLIEIENIRSLRKLITAGEAAVKNKVESFSLTGDYFNAYGPTESSICATIFKWDNAAISPGSYVPIGRPIANTFIYILDNRLALVPEGVVGEICIGGAGLARGYLNNPELTGMKFIQNPFKVGERLYKTGDMGKWLADGNIEFTGRSDSQVKINGYRIELEEIEQVLLKKHVVKEVKAIVKETKEGNKNLVLYYVPVAGEEVSGEMIRDIITSRLPQYMVPNYFVSLTNLPLTISGKIDSRKLPDPEGLEVNNGIAYVPAKDDLERKLVRLWEELLEVNNIGVKDDFFQLGGSSLKAMMLIKRIMDELEFMLPIRILFLEKSIENVARYIRHYETAKIPQTVVFSDNGDISDISYNQLNYFSEWGIGNNVVMEKNNYTQLDIERLRWAVSKLVSRHEILRTVFVKDNGIIKQQVINHKDFTFYIADPVYVTSESEFTAVLEQENNRKIDLFGGDLFFIKVYQLAENDYRVLFSIHHILTDGFSAGVMQRELTGLYGGQDIEEPKTLHHQYRDFSSWQHNFLQSEEGSIHRSYWLKKLNGFNREIKQVSPQQLEERLKGKGITIETVIDGAFYAETDHFVKENGLTYATLFITALNLFLYQIHRIADITFSTTVSGRNSKYYGEMDFEQLIGFFANALLVRNKFEEVISVADFMHQVQDSFLDDLTHEAYPFVKLMSELPGITPDILQATGFFNYHNYQHLKTLVYENDLPETGVKIVETDPIQRAFGLTVMEYSNCMKIQFKYNPDAFEYKKPFAVFDQFLAVLKQIVYQPESLINKMSVSNSNEKIAE